MGGTAELSRAWLPHHRVHLWLLILRGGTEDHPCLRQT